MKRLSALLLAAAALPVACGGEPPGSPSAAPPPGAVNAPGTPPPRTFTPGFRFVDTAASAGLDAVTWCGRPDKPHLLESGGNGLALLDYDADGDLDLYLVAGWRLAGAEVVERAPNRLYRNRGDGTFEDVTAAAGVGDTGWGCGAAVGDIDGDGRPDLHVTNFGPDVLYRNRGDGTFERLANAPGVDGWSGASCFFDADGDGDDDLFVAAYIDCTLDDVLHAEPTLRWKDTQVMMGPFGLEGLRNRYFRNRGDGTFEEATDAAGLEDVGLFYSFGVVALDVDDDRDLDLYVANDSNPNYLYLNDGRGRFTETGLWSGAGLSISGAAQAGMGIAAGDVLGDALPELFVTHFASDASTLYRNLGDALFEDVSATTGVAGPTFAPLSWGTVFADFDLDGDLDLFVANGHIYPQADGATERKECWAQPNLLLENRGGAFAVPTGDTGPGLAVIASSRGVACGDLDGDGDLDLVVSNMDAAPTLLRNEAPRAGTWLIVDAPAARRVEVVLASGTVLRRDRIRGGSFESEHDPRFHFGLGPEPGPVKVRVMAADGTTTVHDAVPVDAVLRPGR